MSVSRQHLNPKKVTCYIGKIVDWTHMVRWTEIANAITMLSPLICWWRHRHRSKHHHTEVRALHRWMIIHIPVSFLYHSLGAFLDNLAIIYFLRKIDFTMIQVHAIVATGAVWRKQWRMRQRAQPQQVISVIRRVFFRASLCQNVRVLVKLWVHQTNNTFERLGSLYLICACTIPYEETCKQLVGVGTLSSMLYIMDDYMFGFGHPSFHIILGYLHHLILITV